MLCIWCKLYWFWNWLKFPDTIWVGLREIMKATGVGSRSTLQGIFPAQDQSQVSHIAGGFFTSWAMGKPKNPGAGSLSLLQSIFLTQESNQGLPNCRQILYQLSYQGSPVKAQEGCYQSHQMHRTGEHQTQYHVFPSPHLSFFPPDHTARCSFHHVWQWDGAWRLNHAKQGVDVLCTSWPSCTLFLH